MWAWIKRLFSGFASKPVQKPVQKPQTPQVEKTEPKPEAPKAEAPVEHILPAKELWYPKAVIPKKKMNARSEYAKGYPEGAIVHFTAGRDKTEDDSISTYEWGLSEGYVFFVIGPTGVVYQGFPLSHGGSHAGESQWPGLGTSVSRKVVGIEVACAGKVDSNGKSWFGVTYPKSELRYVDESYGCPEGYYKKYTPEQEKALIELLVWLKKNNPDVFQVDYILGHHEVAGKLGIGYWRKNDPGGALSMPMPALRELIRSKVK